MSDGHQEGGDNSFRDRIVNLAREKTSSSDHAPALDFVEMNDPYETPREKEKEYNNQADGLRDAAKEVDSRRNAEEPEPLVRKYWRVEDGHYTGEEAPNNETVSAKRAAEDITRARDEEANAIIDQGANAVGEITDAVRGQPQQQPHAQPEQQAAQPQAQQPVSDEQMLQDALARPAIRSAMEQQLAQVEQARSNYAASAGQAFDVAYSALFANYPELQGVNGQSLPAVLEAVRKIDPNRHNQIANAIHATDRLHRAATDAKTAQQQVEAARFEMYARQQDAETDAFVAQMPREEVRAIKENITRVARDYYGVSPEQLAHELRTNATFRSAPFQKMLYQTVRNHLTQEALAQKRAPANIPNVQRPGVSRPSPQADDEGVANALAKFRASPSAKSAADFVNAKRAAAKR